MESQPPDSSGDPLALANLSQRIDLSIRRTSKTLGIDDFGGLLDEDAPACREQETASNTILEASQLTLEHDSPDAGICKQCNAIRVSARHELEELGKRFRALEQREKIATDLVSKLQLECDRLRAQTQSRDATENSAELRLECFRALVLSKDTGGDSIEHIKELGKNGQPIELKAKASDLLWASYQPKMHMPFIFIQWQRVVEMSQVGKSLEPHKQQNVEDVNQQIRALAATFERSQLELKRKAADMLWASSHPKHHMALIFAQWQRFIEQGRTHAAELNSASKDQEYALRHEEFAYNQAEQIIAIHERSIYEQKVIEDLDQVHQEMHMEFEDLRDAHNRHELARSELSDLRLVQFEVQSNLEAARQEHAEQRKECEQLNRKLRIANLKGQQAVQERRAIDTKFERSQLELKRKAANMLWASSHPKHHMTLIFVQWQRLVEQVRAHTVELNSASKDQEYALRHEEFAYSQAEQIIAIHERNIYEQKVIEDLDQVHQEMYLEFDEVQGNLESSRKELSTAIQKGEQVAQERDDVFRELADLRKQNADLQGQLIDCASATRALSANFERRQLEIKAKVTAILLDPRQIKSQLILIFARWHRVAESERAKLNANELRQELDQGYDLLEARHEEYSAMQNERNAQHEMLEQSHNDLVLELRHNVAAHQTEHRALEDAHHDLKSKCISLEHDAKIYSLERDSAQRERKEARLKFEDESKTALEARLKHGEQILELRQELDCQKVNPDRLEAEKSAHHVLSKAHLELERECHDLRHKVQIVSLDLEDLHRKREDAASQHAAQMSVLQETRLNNFEQVKELRDQHSNEQEAVHALRTEHTYLQMEHESFRSAHDRAHQECAQQRSLVHEATCIAKKTQDVERERDAAMCELNLLKQQNVEMKDRLAILALASKEGRKGHQERVRAHDDRVTELHQELQQHRTELQYHENLKSEHREAKQSHGALKQNLEVLKSASKHARKTAEENREAWQKNMDLKVDEMTKAHDDRTAELRKRREAEQRSKHIAEDAHDQLKGKFEDYEHTVQQEIMEEKNAMRRAVRAAEWQQSDALKQLEKQVANLEADHEHLQAQHSDLKETRTEHEDMIAAMGKTEESAIRKHDEEIITLREELAESKKCADALRKQMMTFATASKHTRRNQETKDRDHKMHREHNESLQRQLDDSVRTNSELRQQLTVFASASKHSRTRNQREGKTGELDAAPERSKSDSLKATRLEIEQVQEEHDAHMNVKRFELEELQAEHDTHLNLKRLELEELQAEHDAHMLYSNKSPECEDVMENGEAFCEKLEGELDSLQDGVDELEEQNAWLQNKCDGLVFEVEHASMEVETEARELAARECEHLHDELDKLEEQCAELNEAAACISNTDSQRKLDASERECQQLWKRLSRATEDRDALKRKNELAEADCKRKTSALEQELEETRSKFSEAQHCLEVLEAEHLEVQECLAELQNATSDCGSDTGGSTYRQGSAVTESKQQRMQRLTRLTQLHNNWVDLDKGESAEMLKKDAGSRSRAKK